jgi:hypothetical protein
MIARRALLTILLLLTIPGCRHPDPPAPLAPPAPTTQQTASPPYILHIPGISGESFVDHTFVRGLRQSFVRNGGAAEVEIYDWTEQDAGIPALQAYKRNHAEALKIAAMISDHVKADPHRTIYITSHSGGAGLVAWALESLPPDVKVDSILFIAPALSPPYDLSKALSHVKRAAYVFWSDRDVAILSAGTKVFGTIDGFYTDAAGFTGFKIPANADKTQYAKLHQIAYDPAWVRYLNAGDHIGWMETPFAREVSGPVLQGKSLPAPTTQASATP